MINIIITAYNAHKTIQKTIDSIVKQKNKKELNVYIVNNASDMDYSKILEKYKNKLNIKELKLSNNSELGLARQYGIDHSSSEIVFINSDDIFENSNSLSILYENIEKNNADVVISTLEKELIDGSKVKHEEDTIGLHGKNNNMIVAMCCTENWYSHLIVSLYSLMENTKTIKKIYLLVETENIEEIPYLSELQEKYKVEIVLINTHSYLDKYLKEDSPNRDTEYSNFCFGRLLLPEIVKEDKVLYIDTDAIVRKDISNVWDYDISDYYVAGVKDYGILNDNTLERLNMEGNHYINSGFVVFNLEKIRKEKIQKKWFKLINEMELVYPDQDALNFVCSKKELYLPSMYNYCYGLTCDVHNHDLIKVFHYMGPKEEWVVDHFHSEEWYDAEEKLHDELNSTNEKELIIAMSCNKNWYNHLVISLYSLLKTTKKIKKIYLIVETEKIEEIPFLKELKKEFKVDFKLIDFYKYINSNLKEDSPNKNKRFSDFTFGRLLMPDLIKEKKVLYIDTDMIIKNDISNIWKYDISDSYIAGVKDYGIYERKKFMKKYVKGKYINAGLSIWNLSKMRKDRINQKCFELINENDLPYPDQDALNIICKDKITYIPSMYNICNNVTLEVFNKNLAKIYHFVGEKEDWVVDHYYCEEWYEIEEEFKLRFEKND